MQGNSDSTSDDTDSQKLEFQKQDILDRIRAIDGILVKTHEEINELKAVKDPIMKIKITTKRPAGWKDKVEKIKAALKKRTSVISIQDALRGKAVAELVVLIPRYAYPDRPSVPEPKSVYSVEDLNTKYGLDAPPSGLSAPSSGAPPSAPPSGSSSGSSSKPSGKGKKKATDAAAAASQQEAREAGTAAVSAFVPAGPVVPVPQQEVREAGTAVVSAFAPVEGGGNGGDGGDGDGGVRGRSDTLGSIVGDPKNFSLDGLTGAGASDPTLAAQREARIAAETKIEEFAAVSGAGSGLPSPGAPQNQPSAGSGLPEPPIPAAPVDPVVPFGVQPFNIDSAPPKDKIGNKEGVFLRTVGDGDQKIITAEYGGLEKIKDGSNTSKPDAKALQAAVKVLGLSLGLTPEASDVIMTNLQNVQNAQNTPQGAVMGSKDMSKDPYVYPAVWKQMASSINMVALNKYLNDNLPSFIITDKALPMKGVTMQKEAASIITLVGPLINIETLKYTSSKSSDKDLSKQLQELRVYLAAYILRGVFSVKAAAPTATSVLNPLAAMTNNITMGDVPGLTSRKRPRLFTDGSVVQDDGHINPNDVIFTKPNSNFVSHLVNNERLMNANFFV